MEEQKNKTNYKYNIIEFINTTNKPKILKELNISNATFYRKAGKEIKHKGGFEVCELYMIASILKRKPHELITDAAVQHYLTNKTA